MTAFKCIVCKAPTTGDPFCSRECELIQQKRKFGAACCELRANPLLPIQWRPESGQPPTDSERQHARHLLARMKAGERQR